MKDTHGVDGKAIGANSQPQAALVLIELNGAQFSDINWRVMGAVARLREFVALDVDVLVIGRECSDATSIAVSIPGVRKVLVAEGDSCEFQLAETLVPWLATVVRDYVYVLVGATTFGKSLLPGIAALNDNQPVTDVIRIEAADRFIRPVYAGRACERVVNTQPLKLMSVRGSAFDAITADNKVSASIQRIQPPAKQDASHVTGQELTATSERPELTSASVVVSGGRGLKSSDNFQLLYQLAGKLGAAVGASRAAVDAGFAGNDMQVGQTGKIVAPELYIAVGLSGAVQHFAGMRDSRVVVAINNDPNAPIFQEADYGLVADLFEAIPELIERL